MKPMPRKSLKAEASICPTFLSFFPFSALPAKIPTVASETREEDYCPPVEKRASMSSSRVTNHLANERTFLAWLRTSIAMMGFGVVIVRLRYLTPQATVAHGTLHATQLGLFFAVIALMMVAFALWNFFAVRRAIDAEEYRSDGRGVIIFATAILFLGIVVVFYLLSTTSSVTAATIVAPS